MPLTNHPGRRHDIFGLTPAEFDRVDALMARRAEQVKRERLMVAARWAAEHGSPPAMDSKGWPLDADDWPLRPPSTALVATTLVYRTAVSRAKARKTRRANATKRAAADSFHLRRINLLGMPAYGTQETVAQQGERLALAARYVAMLY